MEAVNRIIRTSTYMYDRGKKTNIFKYTFCCRFTRVNNVSKRLWVFALAKLILNNIIFIEQFPEDKLFFGRI